MASVTGSMKNAKTSGWCLRTRSKDRSAAVNYAYGRRTRRAGGGGIMVAASNSSLDKKTKSKKRFDVLDEHTILGTVDKYFQDDPYPFFLLIVNQNNQGRQASVRNNGTP